jgi:hypothetical protein
MMSCERLDGEPVDRPVGHLPAVPEDHDPVGDPHHVVHVVADQDDRHAGLVERADQVEDALRSLTPRPPSARP